MMVRAMHAAGIEVILDVVYNHTAEGNQLGPTLSFRGIDNATYYRLSPADPRYHVDFTGCGNTLNMTHPRVLQLIMDSLRYWVTEMHVDGFRFDLASTLARELHDVNRLGTFFDIIHQDPVLSQVKLIAEPWDVGPGGYQVGNFPVLWTEWNGKYRDTVRRFWKGDGGLVSEFATRLAGSSDLYRDDGRKPYASINFITCHDGFTLHDLVSYNDKHNEANGEENRDGTNDNNSWNCGDEGPTDDPDINALREQAEAEPHRHPVPLPGRADDPRGRRAEPHPERQQQHLLPGQRADLARLGPRPGTAVVPGVRQGRRPVVAHRAGLPAAEVLQRPGACGAPTSRTSPSSNPRDRRCPTRTGAVGFARSLGVRLAGDLIDDVDKRGEPVVGESLLLLLNAHHEPVPFTLPTTKAEHHLGADPGHGPGPAAKCRPCGAARCTRSGTARWPCSGTRVPEETGLALSATQAEALRKAARPFSIPAG